MDSIKIGEQIWSLENSTVKKFSNGEDIHQCTTKEDWNKLDDFIGGKDNVDQLKSSEGWERVETDDDNNEIKIPLEYDDKHGFKCLPSGWVNDKEEFYQLGSISKLWSSTQNDDGSGKVWSRIVGFKFMSVSIKPENGYSVRLIK